MECILLVDDEVEILKDRSQVIVNLGFRCLTARSGSEAITLIRKEKPDVVFTDQKMADGDGFAVISASRLVDPDVPVIVFTGYGTIELAVEAMKSGAYDYVQKPFLPEMMELVLKKAIEYRRLKKENLILKARVDSLDRLDNIIGRSDPMNQVIKRVQKVSQSDANVLIIGESGTGKELIARSIHRLSARKSKAFIPLDCVALPATLLESELFGFEKGAFTGAVRSKPGVFELAQGGTLFLDEVTEIDFSIQAKLLRVLQERQFRRLGGQDLISVDVRIISATNQNPERALQDKKLRSDLFYRLNVVPILLPPLRERREDIPLLVHHFIRKHNPFSAIEITGISPEAMRRLKKYVWPGNVRELENVIQRIISLAEHPMIRVEDIPEELVQGKTGWLDDATYGRTYRDAKEECFRNFGKQYLGRLLARHQGNISKVAQVAGVSRRTLYRLMEDYQIDRQGISER